MRTALSPAGAHAHAVALLKSTSACLHSVILSTEYVRPTFEVTRYETDVCHTRHAAVPVIALSMGERGLPCRLLAPKFGGVLTFGALSAGRESAPGQPTVEQLRRLFRLPEQRGSTQARPHPYPEHFY